ncbi:cytokine receptor common subunit gamma isoform X1, partial [Silurus asotus]
VSISCLIINFEYVECNWTKPQMQQTNYTFSSLFWRDQRVQECQEYLREQNHNVGCRIPLKKTLQWFHSFDAKLSDGGNQSICKKYQEMTKIVKLNPPSNISLNSSSREEEVCVHWIRSKIKPGCVNYTVGYQKDSGHWRVS